MLVITRTSSSAQPGPPSTHPTKPLAHTASDVSCFNAHKRFMGEIGSFGPFCNEDTGTAPVPTAAGGGAVLALRLQTQGPAGLQQPRNHLGRSSRAGPSSQGLGTPLLRQRNSRLTGSLRARRAVVRSPTTLPPREC